MPNGTKICGVGLPVACPTTTAGSGSSYTLSGSSGSFTGPLTAGAFSPAAPNSTNAINGYISGNILTVTSVTAGATFTGQLGTDVTAKIDNGSGSAGNILTVTAPTSVQFASHPIGPQLAPGMTISNVAGTIASVHHDSIATHPQPQRPAQVNPVCRGLIRSAAARSLSRREPVQGTVRRSGPLPGPPQDFDREQHHRDDLEHDDNFRWRRPYHRPVGSPSRRKALLLLPPDVARDQIQLLFINRPRDDVAGTLTSVIPGQYVIASGIYDAGQHHWRSGQLATCPTTGFPLCGTYTLSNSANTVGSP